jgi:Cu(I)/Ag(I) efflux system periplasmic protein CusF
MTNTTLRITLVATLLLLTACGEKAESNATATANTATEPTGAIGKMAKGRGTVTAIDKAAGKITFDHGPIPEANWPAMTMAFKAKPELLDSVKVGDKVLFELALKDSAGEVTAIQKQ